MTGTTTEASACTLGNSSNQTGCSKSNLSACSGNPTGVCEQSVRELAYQKWEEAGRPEGDGVQFWLDAEKELTADE